MKAAELRAEADRLEREEREAAIVARCYDQGYTWDTNGRCLQRYTEFVPCPGNGSYPHEESYTDEYGSWQSCRRCNGSGRIHVQHHIRRPQWDAPRPKEGE